MSTTKPFVIDKWQVYEASRRLKPMRDRPGGSTDACGLRDGPERQSV